MVPHTNLNMSLRTLNSLGLQSEAMLARAGITTIEQLRELGAVTAYAKAKHENPAASLNLLWALESALTGVPWQQVAREHRTSLLLVLESYQHEHRAVCSGLGQNDVQTSHGETR
jgi:DNA transformation protein and related proteins